MDIADLGEYDATLYRAQQDSGSAWEGREVSLCRPEDTALVPPYTDTLISMIKLGYTEKERNGKERTIEVTIDTRETSQQPSPPPPPPPAPPSTTPKKPKDNGNYYS